jgi:hypothetical protein
MWCVGASFWSVSRVKFQPDVELAPANLTRQIDLLGTWAHHIRWEGWRDAGRPGQVWPGRLERGVVGPGEGPGGIRPS